jgi:hypothetical protein
MAKPSGAQRLVLLAINDLPKDATGFIAEAQIAERTSVPGKKTCTKFRPHALHTIVSFCSWSKSTQTGGRRAGCTLAMKS